MEQAFDTLAARLNAVMVSAEDLLRVSAAIHRLAPEQRSWQTRALCAAQLFGGALSDKAYAVTARLEALGRLVEGGHLPDVFAPCAADGTRLLAEPVFEAAASVPLAGTTTACQFEPDRFLACVMAHAQVEIEDSAGAD